MVKQKISIAMCTYNGNSYLEEQLSSISQQTRLPDEMVVCDDGSTDLTVQILKDFEKRTSFSVRFYCNENRLGYAKNFEKAINLCDGDIIFLSDQDDVWVPNKIKIIENKFKSNPNCGFVFSDALLVDEELLPLGSTLWENISFIESQRRLFEVGEQAKVLLKHNVVTGATIAFRKETRNLFLPIPDHWVHDEWITLLLSLLGIEGDFIEEPLISYRQHDKQSIGGQKKNLGEQFQKAIKSKSESIDITLNKFNCLAKRLNTINKLTKKDQELLKLKIDHLKIRKKIHSNNRLVGFQLIFREMLNGNYHRYSNGWKSVVKDLCL